MGLIGTNLLGVPTDEYLPIRISMVIAALWLGGFAIPVLKNPPLPQKVSTADDHETILDSYKLLWRTVVTLNARAPHTLFFLIASAVFRDGWQASSRSARSWPRRRSASVPAMS